MKQIPYVGKFWQINGSKVFGQEKFGESVGSLLKTLAFINIGGENFGKLPTVHQIRQNFPPPKFSHVRYSIARIFAVPHVFEYTPREYLNIQFSALIHTYFVINYSISVIK